MKKYFTIIFVLYKYTFFGQNNLNIMKSKVFQRINKSTPGKVWTPRDFLDLGKRSSIDKSLQRLTNEGLIRRINRGLYDKPSRNDLTQQFNPPDPYQVIEAISRRDKIRILMDGITAANNLGFTNAVPAKIIVHTEARLKPISLGQMRITFKQTAASKLYWSDRPARYIVQALHWLRDTMGRNQNETIIAHRLSEILQDPKYGHLLRDDLMDGFSSLPY
ncbi:MAG: DUF6088 family protein [Rhodobacteraceae bacterium]|nr:DUF6088 family protein [Paracoccaceae bacterium]